MPRLSLLFCVVAAFLLWGCNSSDEPETSEKTPFVGVWTEIERLSPDNEFVEVEPHCTYTFEESGKYYLTATDGETVVSGKYEYNPDFFMFAIIVNDYWHNDIESKFIDQNNAIFYIKGVGVADTWTSKVKRNEEVNQQ